MLRKDPQFMFRINYEHQSQQYRAEEVEEEEEERE